ncbi:MAG: DPP IV N-terminal domain-containing protein [Gemmatimonadota bacterium]|jgi:dipeptidyl aminopeptidase/acylaminoacyl peptidase
MRRAITVVVALALQTATARAQGVPATPDYARAERFLTWNTRALVYGDAVAPHWMAGGSRFWYRVTTPHGAEFMRVDVAAASRRPLFDNARLASAITLAGDTIVSPEKLPFRTFELGGEGRNEGVIEFDLRHHRYSCDITAYVCTIGDTLASRVPYARSPDGNWEAYVRDHNLWIRRTDRSDSTQLTTDGADRFSYGVPTPRPGQLIRGTPIRPVLQWAPDSRRIAVPRFDERNVLDMMLYSSTHSRPKAYTYPYALPGDSVIPVFDTFIIDIASKRAVRVDAAPQTAQANGITGMRDSTWITVQWAQDGGTLYLTHADRGPRKLMLLAADASTGATRVVAGDSSRTYVELNLSGSGSPNWRVLGNGDVIWFSERDGWAHLYRYANDGTLKNRITSGPWTVGDILHIDEAAGRMWLTARGREPGQNPAYAQLYRVNLDGSGLTLLSPEVGDHTIRPAPDGGAFVDSWSEVNVPPVTVLRAPDGRVLAQLEQADISALLANGWRAGEPFTVKARDGVTDISGVMWKPTDFDSTKSYPVLDHIYPGPQIAPSPTRFFPTNDDALVYATMGQVQAVAELGFIVVSVDHMGVNLRSKAFHDAWFGDMGDNGIPDHIAAIQQLAARHPYLDLDRVGIYGHSGGGFASTDALLRYPDFFKVAVSTSGNHDNRTYYYGWAERYQGLLVRDTLRGTDSYSNQSNPEIANNLKGKLFLIHGDMDDNVHPAMTLQVVNALIKANKSFDLLIVPDVDHGVTQIPYVIRRSWDFFVENLLGAEPPDNYTIAEPPAGG